MTPISIVEGFASAVLPMPYHMAPMPTPRRGRGRDVGRRCGPRPPRGALPVRAAAPRGRRQPGARVEHLPARRRRARTERVRQPELEPIHAELRRRARPSAPRGRSPPGARRSRGTRRRAGCSCRSRGSSRATASYCVRAHRVHRHAVRDRRTPGRVGAGVEVAVEAEARSAGRRRRPRRSRGSGPDGASGWRPSISGRVQTARTGRSSRQAAIAISGWTPRSSLPPKPPPQAVGMIRTCSGAMPRISATSSRSMYGVWVLTRELDPVADAPRAAGLGLDVGVLDEGRLDLDLGGHGRRPRARRRRRRARGGPRIRTLPGEASWSARRIGGEGVVEAAQRRQRLPA